MQRRLELAQYRELAAFAQFGSELDADTREKLAQGERIREVLKQPQYQPMPVEYQVITLYVATGKYLLDILYGMEFSRKYDENLALNNKYEKSGKKLLW